MMNFKGAKWITHANAFDRNIIYFKKDFFARDGFIKAELFISGLGFYDFKINDLVVEQGLFKPNISDYKKRKKDELLVEKGNEYFAYYDKYMITNYLKPNSLNELFVRVGTGYFHLNDKLDFAQVDYGKSRLKFLIKLYYRNGVECFISDSSTLSMISKNKSSLFLGDDIDFNDEKCDYKPSIVINEKINLRKEDGEIDRIFDKIPGKTIVKTPRRVILDFGFNHSGNLSGFVKGKKKSKITIKYAESLNDDGTLNLSSSAFQDFISKNERSEKRFVCQKNSYTLSGGKDLLSTYFSYRCYRYVEIEGEDDFDIEDIHSIFIHGDIKQDLFLECDNQVINSLFHKYVLTQYDNFHSGMSTDCPHREKLPYTGDAALVRNNLLYFFDYEKQMHKFLKDIYASQGRDGFIPYSAPDFGVGGGYFWSLSVALIPFSLYERTGKLSYLKEALPHLQRFVEYFSLRLDEDGVVETGGKKWLLGDWLSPETTDVDISFFSTSCYFLSVKYLIEYKKRLGLAVTKDDNKLLSRIKEVIKKRFYHPDTHTFASDKQGETVLGAYLGIVVDPLVKKHIRQTYSQDPHFDTGIVMTPILVNYLLNNSMEDLLFKMLNKTSYPSYSYMMENETTLCEHWSKKWPPFKSNNGGEYIHIDGDTSHCHPMFGSILYDVVKHIIGFDLSDIKNKVIKFNYLRKFGLKYLKIHYKNNYVALKNNILEIEVAKDYKLHFNGVVYMQGKYIIYI